MHIDGGASNPLAKGAFTIFPWWENLCDESESSSSWRPTRLALRLLWMLSAQPMHVLQRRALDTDVLIARHLFG